MATFISDTPEAGAPEFEITPAMIEAAARCLRAYLREDGISHSESEIIAEKALRAGLCRRAAGAHFPRERV